MKKVSFVVEYPESSIPAVPLGAEILGGTLVSATVQDKAEQNDLLTSARMMRTLGRRWQEILLYFSELYGWAVAVHSKAPYTCQLTVIPEQYHDAYELVREIVPAIYSVEVDCLAGGRDEH